MSKKRKRMSLSRVPVDNTKLNADVTWQELQGIADRVRRLKRLATSLNKSIHDMQRRARSLREPS